MAEREAFFDTHCHLDFPDFAEDRQAVLERARAAGVVGLVNVGTCLASSQASCALAGAHEGVHAAVGIHPNHLSDAEPGELEAVLTLAADPAVVAVGETGLDFYRERTPEPRQREAFRQHLACAAALDKPVIVHSRQSGPAVLEELEAQAARQPVRGVFHCFTETPEILDRALALGLKIGISGIVTFPKGDNVRAVVPRIPDDQLLLDSDCPFLAPVPHRGQRNEPAYVVAIAKVLAELRGLALADVARITTRNARELFLPEEVSEEGRIAYAIRDSLYLALTNDCSNACTFCARRRAWRVKGHGIHLAAPPEAAEVLAAMGDTSEYREVVFCGFGEPTLRLPVLLAVADALKRRGARVRLNTNGQGNLIHNRDILPDLQGRIDVCSVSLNTADPDQYAELCPSRFGAAAFPAVCAFVRGAVQVLPEVVVTAVDMPGVDVPAVERLAGELGARFRLRSFVDVG